MNHKLDTADRVFFYEQEFYVLSNFSAFSVRWNGIVFSTAEHVYHWEKFPHMPELREEIRTALSAHEAFKIAQRHKDLRVHYWDQVKVPIMRKILVNKLFQHDYVRRKLLETGDRVLIEDSWRDGFWGWGEDQCGHNQLGKLWMELRTELRQQLPDPGPDPRGFCPQCGAEIFLKHAHICTRGKAR